MLIFLGTFGSEFMLRGVFAVILILSGFVLNIVTRRNTVETNMSGQSQTKVLVWVAASLLVIFMTSSIVPLLKLGIDTSGSNVWIVLKMFGMLIAVSEEQFFRAFATNLFIGRVGVLMGIPLSGVFFAVYHSAVYGTSPSLLIFVALSGTVLSYAAWRTQRVSTPMIAHIINNFLVS